jgi:hypothetical protein
MPLTARTSQPLRHRHLEYYKEYFRKQMRKMKPKERERFKKNNESLLNLLKKGMA